MEMTDNGTTVYMTAGVAAKWWADQLRNGARLDAGDGLGLSLEGQLRGLLLQVLERKNNGITDAVIDAFETALAGIIDAYLLENGSYPPMWIAVDQRPDDTLQQAATEVGFPAGSATFPWKTEMEVTTTTVRGSTGNGRHNFQLEINRRSPRLIRTSHMASPASSGALSYLFVMKCPRRGGG